MNAKSKSEHSMLTPTVTCAYRECARANHKHSHMDMEPSRRCSNSAVTEMSRIFMADYMRLGC